MVQSKIEDILAWRNYVETISVMIMFSLVAIDPNLLLPFPLFIFLFALLIPSYQARHPPPPLTLSDLPTEVTQPTLPAPQPAKPAPELSRDFFMNMRDIQNRMDDFSNLYDIVRKWVIDLTTFHNEPLSSTLLAFSSIAAIALILLIEYLPVRWFVFILGNAAILSCHPALYKYLTTTVLKPEEIQKLKQRIDIFVQEDYIPPPPVNRIIYTVEIFESRRLLPPIPPNYLPDWSDSYFSPFPPQLINATTKLSAVTAPPGFKFAEEDWKVDEDKEKWARERGTSDDSGFWYVDEDDLRRDADGWVVYEAGGWKVRRLTRGVIRAERGDKG
jgi:Integral peroxisomal membrane peroxin